MQVSSKKSNWKNTIEIENKHLKKQQKTLEIQVPLDSVTGSSKKIITMGYRTIIYHLKHKKHGRGSIGCIVFFLADGWIMSRWCGTLANLIEQAGQS